MNKKTKHRISYVLQILLLVIIGQTLFFKFTAAPESVELFTELGMEPTGRLLIGTLELIAVILLIIPQSVAWGALLAWGLMSGAIMGHITQLGWAGDRGSLGLLAILCWISASAILALRYDELPFLREASEDQA